jgi:hypothetical protein
MNGQSIKVNSLFILFLAWAWGFFWSEQVGYAQSEEAELHLVSPIGAVSRSIIMPGWGQFYAHSRWRGSLSLIGATSLVLGGLVARKSFKDVYNNEYIPVARKDKESPEALFQYNRANQRFKLQQFFFFATVGVWAYSIIDSYVGANLYNATTKANLLIDDAKQIEKLGIQFEATPTQLHLGVVKYF